MNKIISLDALDNSFHSDELKPKEAILHICDALAINSANVHEAKSRVIQYNKAGEKLCILLHRGSMAVHRRGDGIVMISESAPFIFGLSNQLNCDNSMYLRTLEACELSFISLVEAQKIISKKNLWKNLCDLLVYTTSRVYEHCAQVHQMSAYDIIRFQLNELLRESDEVRLKTTVPNYIKTRTYLSRSGIMRILSELKTGGYIQVEKGILQGINYLPKKF